MGVYHNKKRNSYEARVYYKGSRYYVGSFKDELTAKIEEAKVLKKFKDLEAISLENVNLEYEDKDVKHKPTLWQRFKMKWS